MVKDGKVLRRRSLTFRLARRRWYRTRTDRLEAGALPSTLLMRAAEVEGALRIAAKTVRANWRRLLLRHGHLIRPDRGRSRVATLAALVSVWIQLLLNLLGVVLERIRRPQPLPASLSLATPHAVIHLHLIYYRQFTEVKVER